MNVTQYFKLALKSLRTSKMRAFLTMLGIIIGVAAVIIIISLGNGLTRMVEQRVEKLGVTQIMAEGNGFGQVLVELQGPGDGSGDPHDLQGMGQPGSVMIPLRLQKHLCFVLEPPERLAVDDPIHVPLIAGAHFVFFLRAQSSPGFICPGRPGGEHHVLPLFQFFTNRHSQHPLYSIVQQAICPPTFGSYTVSGGRTGTPRNT